jgi:soluble lytic murein transglycosylase
MQLLPSVGETVARSLSFPVYSTPLLFEPEANMELGTAHLAEGLRRYSDVARSLAAYNAGASRVTRWEKKAGAADPELFTERVPYVETRDYVRIVQRNAVVYRALGLGR